MAFEVTRTDWRMMLAIVLAAILTTAAIPLWQMLPVAITG